MFVAETAEEAQAEAGEGVTLTRDPDVLDTLVLFGALAVRDARLARQRRQDAGGALPE